MFRTAIAASVAALCLAGSAGANDSVASMGTGGLVIQRTAGIEMRAEDLFVSADEIRVQYRFFNRTDRDISTIVAFPMPDVTGLPEGDIGISQEDPTQPTPFHTMIDGRPVRTQVEQKAVLAGVDHTARLIALHVPLLPYAQATVEAIGALPEGARAELVAAGLVEDRSWEDAGRTHHEYAPLWTLKTTHYWTQVFPAGRELAVDHRYRPAIGGSAGSIVAEPLMAGSEAEAEQAARYCTDADFVAAARRKRAQGLYLTETWVDYVLTTGANWAEPIGDFRLVVDKGDANNLVSFCETGVTRIGPTRFEVRHRDFTPTRDLSVLIVRGERLQP